VHILLFLNKYRNVVYEVTIALHNFFSSSLKSPVTDFGYSSQIQKRRYCWQVHLPAELVQLEGAGRYRHIITVISRSIITILWYRRK
jgi:hypothetical protein